MIGCEGLDGVHRAGRASGGTRPELERDALSVNQALKIAILPALCGIVPVSSTAI
jgi:hypothetical protein